MAVAVNDTVEGLTRNWGWIVLRGVVAVLFGLLTLFNPAITLGVLIMFFAAYALVDGIFTIVAAVANRRGESHWGMLLASGVLSIGIGCLAFLWPGVTALVLLYLIAGWAIVTGVGQIAAAIRLRRSISGEWLLILAGVLSVLVGLALLVFPVAGALVVTLWIGAYATVLGVLLIALGLRLRSWGQEHSGRRAPETG
ncbi:MAG TPA: HdeD family acid-resistance protein [Gemmatimonadaceae bacterium]